jgi:hypothetical protein
MRLEETSRVWEGQKEGGHGTTVGKEVNSKNYMKLDYDTESVAVQEQHDPSQKNQECKLHNPVVLVQLLLLLSRKSRRRSK